MNRVAAAEGRRASMEWEKGQGLSLGNPIAFPPSTTTLSSPSQPIPIAKKSNIPTPNLVLPTIDGYTVSHSLLIDNMPTDAYGFLLDERHGLTAGEHREFERRYAGKYERQVQRWANIVPLAKGDLVVFPQPSDKIKRALRKGVPRDLRPKAWFYYSGAQGKQDEEPKRYVELVRTAQQNLNSPLYNQIESDVSHTFANNRRFRALNIMSPPQVCDNSVGYCYIREEPRSHAALKRILMAIAYAFPNVSYTNGLNFIAAALLLVTENEPRSFWILYCILEKLLPSNFYTDMNLGCNVEQDVLGALIAWKLPAVHKKLQELEMSLHIVTSAWFTHLFVDQLPFETLLRVWDAFLLEGSKVILRVSLALFKINQDELIKITDSFELAAFIRNMPRRQLDVITLLETAFEGIGRFSTRWLEEERTRAIPFWKAKHAVRRFSRVSPAYCQAPVRVETPKPSFCAPVVVASDVSPEKPSLRMALEDPSPIMFERPEEIRTITNSDGSGSSCSASIADDATNASGISSIASVPISKFRS